MHIPKPFTENNRDVLFDFIEANSFGTLVVTCDGEANANHIPFELVKCSEKHALLRGHVSRSNPVWESLTKGEVLVLFSGANSYISPSLYPARKTHGKVAPSWNYSAVHVYGSARSVSDTAWIVAHLTRLTDKHEKGKVAPWSVTEAPVDFIESAASHVVGIEITITKILGKFQASQQYKEEVRLAIVEGLLAEKTDQTTQVARMISERQSMHLKR